MFCLMEHETPTCHLGNHYLLLEPPVLLNYNLIDISLITINSKKSSNYIVNENIAACPVLDKLDNGAVVQHSTTARYTCDSLYRR